MFIIYFWAIVLLVLNGMAIFSLFVEIKEIVVKIKSKIMAKRLDKQKDV